MTKEETGVLKLALLVDNFTEPDDSMNKLLCSPNTAFL